VRQPCCGFFQWLTRLCIWRGSTISNSENASPAHGGVSLLCVVCVLRERCVIFFALLFDFLFRPKKVAPKTRGHSSPNFDRFRQLIVRLTLALAVSVPAVPVTGKEVVPVIVTFSVPECDAAVVVPPE
jgi:hypothetical protein